MRYSLLALPLLALITIGCGDEKKKEAPATPTPVTPAVVYDFANYLIPTTTQTNKYNITNSSNEDGSIYRKGNLDNYQEGYILIDSNITNMSKDGVDKFKYVKNAKTIVQNDFTSGEMVKTINREFKINDTLSDINGTKCTASEAMTSTSVNSKTYTDIIKTTCAKTTQIKASAGGFNITTDKTVTEETLFAKEVGIVSVVNIDCEDAYSDINNSQHKIKCNKVETILTSVIAN